jgi:transcriptional regulator with PAS, ATPase and Fis domain
MIEESVFRRVGGVKDITVDVRIIAASNLNIHEQIRKGNFREDLYYRLNVIPLIVPPLRTRGRDVLLLADHFIHKYSLEMKKNINGLSPKTEQDFLQRQWPGNVRELKNLVEREVLFSNSQWLAVAGNTTPGDLDTGVAEGENELLSLAAMERKYILKVLNTTAQNKTRAAKILGISRTTLRDKIS